eukprot:gene5301-biopygen17696
MHNLVRFCADGIYKILSKEIIPCGQVWTTSAQSAQILPSKHIQDKTASQQWWIKDMFLTSDRRPPRNARCSLSTAMALRARHADLHHPIHNTLTCVSPPQSMLGFCCTTATWEEYADDIAAVTDTTGIPDFGVPGRPQYFAAAADVRRLRGSARDLLRGLRGSPLHCKAWISEPDLSKPSFLGRYKESWAADLAGTTPRRGHGRGQLGKSAAPQAPPLGKWVKLRRRRRRARRKLSKWRHRRRRPSAKQREPRDARGSPPLSPCNPGNFAPGVAFPEILAENTQAVECRENPGIFGNLQ